MSITKDLTLSQIDEYVDSLVKEIRSLESQLQDYHQIVDTNKSSWKDALRAEVIRMLVEKDEEIKNIGAEAECVLIKTALEFNCNRRQETAAILGYGRNTITKKAAEFNLKF